MDAARIDYPDYTFVKPLTPSEQKCAFHVQDRHGTDLCLKVISPTSSLDRVQREISALQSIDHPNVVKLREYTFSSRPGLYRHFMVEEFIEGEDLADALLRGRWARDRAADVFAEICDGLEVLRQQNVVHRDLKPNNIRLRPSGKPVIIDFGLARLLDMPDLTATAQGTGIGTPLYFSPEQFDGRKRDIEHRTDLFALGVILHQAILGTHPFWRAGMTIADLSQAVQKSEEFAKSADFLALPNEWQLLLKRLLSKDRARRPLSAAQAAAVLRQIRGK